MHYRLPLFAALCLLALIPASAQTDSRLIAYNFYGYGNAGYYLKDSTEYQYSGTRGGDLDSKLLPFDNAIVRNYDTLTKTFTNTLRQVQLFDAAMQRTALQQLGWNTALNIWNYDRNTQYTYDAAGNLQRLLQQRWNETAVAWEHVLSNDYTYDSGKRLLSATEQIWDGSSWQGTDRFLYQYTAAGDTSLVTYSRWESGAWKHVFRDSFDYNTARQKTQFFHATWNDTTAAWTAAGLTDYTYLGSGELSSETLSGFNRGTLSYIPVNRHLYTYNSTGDRLSDTLQRWNESSAAYDQAILMTYDYDASANCTGDIKSIWDAGAWLPIKLFARTFTASGKYHSIVSADWNDGSKVWDSSERNNYTYNTHNQLLSDASQVWDKAGASWYSSNTDIMLRYFYQTYSTVGIAAEKTFSGQLELFPVPASTAMSIRLQLDKAANIQLQISDLNGRPYRQWQRTATELWQEQVDISGLAAGQYLLQCSAGANGSRTLPFTVVR